MDCCFYDRQTLEGREPDETLAKDKPVQKMCGFGRGSRLFRGGTVSMIMNLVGWHLVCDFLCQSSATELFHSKSVAR
jgi:hypothetical protein